MRFTAFLLLSFLITVACSGQQPGYTAFTVSDGLPSNHVYHCVEDDKGFLWVATDAGIARFDGKHFQVFTTAQGLPDNEVLEVVKEKNGRIWVNCFRQSPSYFDEVQNRFINAAEDSNLAKVSGTTNMYLCSLAEGGVLYRNENASYIFRDKKLTVYIGPFVRYNDDGSRLMLSRYFSDSMNLTNITLHKEDKKTDSIPIYKTPKGNIIFLRADAGKYYLFDKTTLKGFIYSEFQLNPLRVRIDSVTVPWPFFNFRFTNSSIYVLSERGQIFVYDKRSLQPTYVFSGDFLPNGFYDDSKGNLWICTIDKGLLAYRKKQLTGISLPAGYNKTNFLSIARKPDGTLLAGNYYGEIIETGKAGFSVHPVVKKAPSRIRKILVLNGNVYCITDAGDGTFVNYTKRIKNAEAGAQNVSGKTAIFYNDSTILIGASTGLTKVNTVTQTHTETIRYKRVSALAKANDSTVYMGSTDGLYKFHYYHNSFTPLAGQDPLFGERVMALCFTPDNLLWIATSGNGIVVVKDDSILFHITIKNGIISNACRSITAGPPGQVWLGTSQGISVINYRSNSNKPDFSIRNLSMNDGVTGNEINEMVFASDTIFAATGNGISVIPADTIIPKFNIPVSLIRMRVNQRDTILSDNYQLGYSQKNIEMQFAGIELTGHFKNLQYKLDGNNNWTDLTENTLTLQLSNGTHFLQVRAVDVNGNTSDKILTIRIAIATPFWKALWFWIAVAVLLQLIVIYLVNRRQKRRKEAKLAKEIAGVQTAALEQQAFTSLMNPHFLFNALNSIQHYINVQDRQNANRYLSDFASLIRKNFEAAHQSFIPLDQELENIKLYLRLEQMRFNDRFSYRIHVAENLDTEDWMIPTMLMQPFLENALLHGIMPSSIKGELTIDIKEADTNLVITIIDNGIGMINSRALKENAEHKSRGMELIEKRMTALSRFGTEPVSIRISPAFPDEKNPGNKISLRIPAGLYEAWLKAQHP